MEKIKIGLLDFGERSNLNSLLGVDDLINYAVQAEKLGFSRLWLGEHHTTSPTCIWSNPEMLLPILAGMTDKIKIGVAGILLWIHSPYHVACNFKMLSNLFPNRIDLGLAGAPSRPQIVKYATGIENSQMIKSFKEKFKELVWYLRNEDELLNNENGGVVMPPYKGKVPEIWSLGLSYGGSTDRAIELGINIARSIFHTGSDVEYKKDQLEKFKEEYFNKYNTFPKITLVLSGICHKTSQKAEDISQKIKLGYNQNIVGCKSKFYDTICKFQEMYGIDEIIFMNAALESKDRFMSIELISDVFNLQNLETVEYKEIEEIAV